MVVQITVNEHISNSNQAVKYKLGSFDIKSCMTPELLKSGMMGGYYENKEMLHDPELFRIVDFGLDEGHLLQE